MSLRVLLADESASIRKVFQLGLQDFGAEVKSVHNGLDVVQVAEKFSPHIIFADILLQKKNGYEVCEEIKQHAKLGAIPVVLMWSSFMELDQKRFKGSGAEGELEKPFDVERMRGLIREFVKHTKSQQISQFLDFPKSIKAHFDDEGGVDSSIQENSAPAEDFAGFEIDTPEEERQFEVPVTNSGVEESDSVFNRHLSEFSADEEEDVEQDIPQEADQAPAIFSDNPAEDWAVKPLNFQKPGPTKTPPPEDGADEFQSMSLQGSQKLNLEDFLYRPETATQPPPPPENTPTPSQVNSKIANVQVAGSIDERSHYRMSPEEMEHLVRSETRQFLKDMLAAQLPKIVEKVVREELEKVLQQEMAVRDAHKS